MLLVPEVVALHRNKICTSGFESLGRMELWAYYASVFPYFWVLATPVVSFVFGTYLYLSLNIFGCHYNEAFSSLRIASYKNFLRLHFRKDGQLEVFALGVDKMPHRWVRYDQKSLHCQVVLCLSHELTIVSYL